MSTPQRIPSAQPERDTLRCHQPETLTLLLVPEMGASQLRGRRTSGERAVRSQVVVLTSPLFDQDLCLLERVEELAVQEFVEPAAYRRGDELGAVSASDVLRDAVL